MTLSKLIVLLAAIASFTEVSGKNVKKCSVGFDIAPEIHNVASLEDITAYINQLVRRVNVIFGSEITQIKVGWIRNISLGLYSTSDSTLAYYGATSFLPIDGTDRNPCVRMLISNRRFSLPHIGIALVGSACSPGVAAVFNADPRIIRSGDFASAWSPMDDAALTAAHEIGHTYGLEHSENAFDFMWAYAVTSENADSFSTKFRTKVGPECIEVETNVRPGTIVLWPAVACIFISFVFFITNK